MRRSGPLWPLPLLAFCAAACQPEIGDPCTTPSDCSVSGDRICDNTQRGGYCTKFNCEPGGCPDEAVCVAFHGETGLGNACGDVQDTPRFQRTFCMRKCSNDGDCRSGYACIDVREVEPWSASVVERNSSSKICIVPYSAAEGEPRSDEVCAPPDAGFPDPLSPALPGDGGGPGLDASDATAADASDAATDAEGGALTDAEAGASTDGASGADSSVDAATDAPEGG